jgi:hypothetical protein
MPHNPFASVPHCLPSRALLMLQKERQLQQLQVQQRQGPNNGLTGTPIAQTPSLPLVIVVHRQQPKQDYPEPIILTRKTEQMPSIVQPHQEMPGVSKDDEIRRLRDEIARLKEINRLREELRQLQGATATKDDRKLEGMIVRVENQPARPSEGVSKKEDGKVEGTAVREEKKPEKEGEQPATQQPKGKKFQHSIYGSDWKGYSFVRQSEALQKTLYYSPKDDVWYYRNSDGIYFPLGE